MSVPLGMFNQFLALSSILGENNQYETRIENDADGKPLYIGISTIPNAPTDQPLWYIRKMSLDGNGFLDRVQLPDDAVKFAYAWDDRATYFS